MLFSVKLNFYMEIGGEMKIAKPFQKNHHSLLKYNKIMLLLIKKTFISLAYINLRHTEKVNNQATQMQ